MLPRKGVLSNLIGLLALIMLLSGSAIGQTVKVTSDEKPIEPVNATKPGSSVNSEPAANPKEAKPSESPQAAEPAKAEAKVNPPAEAEPAAEPQATPAQCKRMITASVVAMPQPIMLNRLGATIPDGLTANRYDLGYSQTETAPARSRSWALQLTSGWIDAGAETDYVVPDLSAVTGWQAWWGLAAGVSTNWQQFSQSSDAGVSDLLRADQTTAELDGREYKITQRDGMMTF